MEPELKFPAPTSRSSWLWLQNERFGLLKTKNHLYIYNSLASQTMSVKTEPKFQAPAPPSERLWLRFQSSKIVWAPAPQPWFKENMRSSLCDWGLSKNRKHYLDISEIAWRDIEIFTCTFVFFIEWIWWHLTSETLARLWANYFVRNSSSLLCSMLMLITSIDSGERLRVTPLAFKKYCMTVNGAAKGSARFQKIVFSDSLPELGEKNILR